MNFLAHLHIASFTNTSFVGNFLGDFVKGDPAGQFNAEIVQGIRLHRFVDSYTDQHQVMKSLKPLFPEPFDLTKPRMEKVHVSPAGGKDQRIRFGEILIQGALNGLPMYRHGIMPHLL